MRVPQAVCCADLVHCCPNGYTCDLTAGTCDRAGLSSLPWSTKLPAKQIGSLPAGKPVESEPGKAMEEGRVCSGEAWCKGGGACCEASSGARGCCTLDNVSGGRERSNFVKFFFDAFLTFLSISSHRRIFMS